MPKNMRHRVNVMRPTSAEGSIGQLQGKPELLMANVPCSIKPISGSSESEDARQNGVVAQLTVELYADPRKPIKERDWLYVHPITDDCRKLNIAYVQDEEQNGIELTLFCGENK